MPRTNRDALAAVTRGKTEGYVPWQSPPGAAGIIDRREFLPRRAAGRRVVHLGCADERLTRSRVGTGDLLHEELAFVSASLLGVDVSEAALKTLEELVPGQYLVGDVERLAELALPDSCDLVIAAELIEHLGRPHDFLCGLRDYLHSTGATAIITTPNAYSWTHFARFAVNGREWVHPDHRALYSPVTIQQAFAAADLQVVSMWVHAWDRGRAKTLSARSLGDRVALSLNPWLGVGIVAEVAAGARPSGDLEHALQRHPRPLGGPLVDDDLIDDLAPSE